MYNVPGYLAAPLAIPDPLNAAGGKAITTAVTFTAPTTAANARFVEVDCETNDCHVTCGANAAGMTTATTLIGRKVRADSYRIFALPTSPVIGDRPVISVIAATGTTNVNVFWLP